MSETPAVSTPETAPTQEASKPETTAQDDLNALLNEYEAAPEETPTKTPAETPVQAAPEVSQDRLAAVEAFMQRQDKADTDMALSDAAEIFKASAGDSLGDMTRDGVEGLIHLEAFRNPKIAHAFQDRFNNPEKWDKTVQALGKGFAEKATKTDHKSTESWDAVDSAMHSAASSTTTNEPAPDLNKMSDQQFTEYKAGL